MILVQTDDFDLAREYAQLRLQAGDAGAIVTFTGLVREFHAAEEAIDSLTLEHYPGMTEKALENIVAEARRRWELLGVRVIHRVGRLLPGDQIVLVATASAHRQDAFEAASYIMDYLKSRAPFWKKQARGEDSHWVESRQTDSEALQRWERDSKQKKSPGA